MKPSPLKIYIISDYIKSDEDIHGIVPAGEGSPAGNTHWLRVAGNKKSSC
jgi:hypothetical protein